MADQGPVINRTGRGVLLIALMTFAAAVIVYSEQLADPLTSIQRDGNSFAWWLLIVAAGATGLDVASAKLLDLMTKTK